MIQRVRITVRGAVQGVGFRPFVYRLASELDLKGWVINSPQGVFIEAEAEKPVLDRLLLRLEAEKPAHAYIQSLEYSFLDPAHYSTFEIRQSSADGEPTALVLPDIATCRDCLDEIRDPAARRYRYPFTNCTNCGPRFTIIRALPYDRANTSMASFRMCADCRREYEDPRDRRFHAQPIACPACGPRLALWEADGRTSCTGDEALREATEAIRRGRIVALKGLGGFHLVTDARNRAAVERLRARKRREEKPFALMFPHLGSVREACAVSELEARLLLSAESPIVLLQRKRPVDGGVEPVAASVAPNNPYLGVMLPYTPLHHLILAELEFPVVATSGNLSDEPICTDELEALERLREIADVFLVHDRPIVRHVDDSIVRVMLGRELMMRRARGYAPLPCRVATGRASVLAVGAHLKNTVALTRDGNAFISQHIGDLESVEAYGAFRAVIAGFFDLYNARPGYLAADLHPDYLSTRFALEDGRPVVPVQHHYAHVASCMAENELHGRVLGVSWDGTGYGTDGTVWGGEFLLADETGFERVGHLRPFRLPGGARAVTEPRRAALGLLYEILGRDLFSQRGHVPLEAFTDQERLLLGKMLETGLNSPTTTSAGRLFDAVASLAGIRQTMSFEGQAAMELEFAADLNARHEGYSFRILEPGGTDSDSDPGQDRSAPARVMDWEPAVRAVLLDIAHGTPLGKVSARFHHTLAEMIAEMARLVGEKRVVLTGGCFQNKLLTERTVELLEADGFRPYWHQRVPPNDGGIALGQAAVASHLLEKGS